MDSFLSAMLESCIAVLKKYAEFSGRARRREYWMFALANLIVAAVLGILSQIPVLGILFVIISSLFSLAVLVPGIAVSVRRLHDTNRSGLMLLLCLIPLVGAIIVLYFAIQEGTQGENQYGPDPKGFGAA